MIHQVFIVLIEKETVETIEVRISLVLVNKSK